MVSLDKIFKYLQYLSLIVMLHKVFSLPLNIASSKKECIDESNRSENACSNQPKSAIISANSTKYPNTKIEITYSHADKQIPRIVVQKR
jgi:hypothetical protein